MGGRAGRFVCIFVPMVLTIMALVFLIIVGLGGTNSKNNYLSNLYFLQANTTGVTNNSTFNNNPVNNLTNAADKTSSGKIFIENFYTVSLWNYCVGMGGNVTKSALALGQTSAQQVNYCTARQTPFIMDFQNVWGLSNNAAARVFGPDFSGVLNNYQSKAGRWISTLYILSVTSVVIEMLVGIGGLFSRLGSLWATLASLITTGFLFGFAALTTVTYIGMSASGNVALKNSGIQFNFGPTIYIYMWFAVACSMTATLFWAFSSCCCSGRPREVVVAKDVDESSPYTYDQVANAPFGATQPTTGGGRPGGNDAYRYGQ